MKPNFFPTPAGALVCSTSVRAPRSPQRRTHPALAVELAGQVIEIRSRPTLAPRGATMIAALTLLLAAAAFSAVLLFPRLAGLALPSLLLLSVAAIRRPQRGKPRAQFYAAMIVPSLLFHAAVAVCAATQCLYYTYGGVGAMVPVGLFFLALLVAGVPCWWRRYRLAVILAMVVTAGFAAEQIVLTIRLQRLYDEAQLILEWSEQTGRTTGTLPDTLDSYPWSRPELREFISYFDGDTIEFHPIPKIGVQHGYSAGRGWYFNDD